MFLKNIILTTVVLSLRSKLAMTSAASETGAHSCKAATATYSVAYVTVPDEALAKKLARGLIEKKLAACVNIIPKIASVYEWKGEIVDDEELLLMIKTRTSRVEELIKFVRENHSYEVCEVISLRIDNGNAPYLKWLGDVVPEKGKTDP